MTLTNTTRLRRNDAVLTADVDGEIILMDADQSLYFSLNRTGSEIWRHLADTPDWKTLTELLCQSFEGDPVMITQETRSLMDQFLSHRLVFAESP